MPYTQCREASCGSLQCLEREGLHLEFLEMLREWKDLAISKPCEVSVAVFLQHRTTNASAAECCAAGGLAVDMCPVDYKYITCVEDGSIARTEDGPHLEYRLAVKQHAPRALRLLPSNEIWSFRRVNQQSLHGGSDTSSASEKDANCVVR